MKNLRTHIHCVKMDTYLKPDLNDTVLMQLSFKIPVKSWLNAVTDGAVTCSSCQTF